MTRSQSTWIDGHFVRVSRRGVLRVESPAGPVASVLLVGTHAALDGLGAETKAKVVEWWKRCLAQREVRKW